MIALWLLACAHPVPPAPTTEVSHITPTVAPGNALSEREAMLLALRGADGAIAGCYEKALARDPHRYGDLVVRVELELDGAVREVRSEFSTLADPTLEACVLDALRAQRFPTPSRDGLSLRYPYVFTSPNTPPEVTRALLLQHGLLEEETTKLPDDEMRVDPDTPPPPGIVVTW